MLLTNGKRTVDLIGSTTRELWLSAFAGDRMAWRPLAR